MIASVAVTLIISLLSLTASLLLIVTIIHAKFYRLRQNVFVLMTSSFDFVRATSLFAKSIVYLSPTGNATALCDVIGFLHTWSSVGCVLGLFTVTYDRLAYLIGPVTYGDRISLRMAAMLVGYVIGHSLFCAALPLIGWGDVMAYRSNDDNATDIYCVINWKGGYGYGYFLLVFGYVIPMTIVLFTTVRLGRLVRKRIKFVKVYSDPEASLWPMHMRAAIARGRLTELDTSYVTIWRAVMTSSVTCLVSWSLYIVGAALMIRTSPTGVVAATDASVSMVTLSMSTHVINFLVYGVYNKRYRFALTSVFLCGDVTRTDIQNISGIHNEWSSSTSGTASGTASVPASVADGVGRPPVPIPKTVWVDKSSISYA